MKKLRVIQYDRTNKAAGLIGVASHCMESRAVMKNNLDGGKVCHRLMGV